MPFDFAQGTASPVEGWATGGVALRPCSGPSRARSKDGERFRLIALIETCSFNQDTDSAVVDSYACSVSARVASPEVCPIGVRTTVVRAARAATEESQRECRRECRGRISANVANVVDNSGAAPIISPVSGLCVWARMGARRPIAGVTFTRERRANGTAPMLRIVTIACRPSAAGCSWPRSGASKQPSPSPGRWTS